MIITLNQEANFWIDTSSTTGIVYFNLYNILLDIYRRGEWVQETADIFSKIAIVEPKTLKIII